MGLKVHLWGEKKTERKRKEKKKGKARSKDFEHFQHKEVMNIGEDRYVSPD